MFATLLCGKDEKEREGKGKLGLESSPLIFF
jgi:hypothetical protein